MTLSISCHSLLACRVSAERSDVNLMGIPLCVIGDKLFVVVIIFIRFIFG